MTKTAIESHQLSKTYGSLLKRKSFQALRNVSIEVPQGRIFGLLGPNGAGKTTFVKILLGIISKTTGDASVMGFPAGSVECRRMIGYLPEQMRIPRHLTGIGALHFYGSLSGLSSREVSERAPDLLAKVGMQGREKELTRRYSKGMVQRIGLAQSLLHRPKVLILDEPTDGLDPRARREMRQVLERLREEEGVTIFLNSHILQEVEVICDDVAIMHRGELRYCGPVSEVNQFLSGGTKESYLKVQIQLAGKRADIAKVAEGIGEVNWAQAEPIRPAGGISIAPVVLESNAPVSRDSADELVEATLRAEFASQDSLDEFVDLVRAARLSLMGLNRHKVSLEDAFMQLTGGEMAS